MKGIVIYCANEKCRKPILRDAYLRTGSRCSLRCFACGSIVKLEATPNGVYRAVEKSAAVLDAAKGGTMAAEKPDEGSVGFVVET